MKKLIVSACAFLLFGGLMAQTAGGAEQAQALGIEEAVDRVTKHDLSDNIQGVTKGVAFFTEDFANGFDGNNGIGPWDPQDSGGDDPIWMMATPQSPGGQFSINSGPLQSTTASNGWVIYDTDLWNTPDIIGDTQGFLVSPTIDCSDRNTVIVTFDHYYRYCCFPTPPISVGASADGGATWTEFAAAGDVYAATNVQSDQLTTSIDVSCVAANEEDVQIRFSYNANFNSGYSHYFWGIDDVMLSEATAEFDVKVHQVTNGDVFNEWEYRVTPIQQARAASDGGVFVSTIYENVGVGDLTGVTVTVDILDEGGTILSTTVAEPFDYPANSNSSICPTDPDTLNLFTNWEPEENGNYTVRSTITADQDLGNVEDDILGRDIAYTDCVFAHDDSNLNVTLAPRETSNGSGIYRNAGYGSLFTITNEGSVAIGAMVALGSNTDEEFECEIRLYTIEEGEGLNDASYVSTFYEITPEDIPGPGQEMPIYIPFDDEIELNVWDPNTGAPVYMMAITNDEESPNRLSILAQDRSDTDNSSARIDLSGNQEYVWFTSQPESPYVRMVLDDECDALVGLEEELEELNVELGQNMPNPTTGLTTVQFTMEESLDIDFQITDNMGRIIYTQMMGQLAPGQHEVVLDASNFAPGIYQYSLISDNKRTTKTMVIAK